MVEEMNIEFSNFGLLIFKRVNIGSCFVLYYIFMFLLIYFELLK